MVGLEVYIGSCTLAGLSASRQKYYFYWVHFNTNNIGNGWILLFYYEKGTVEHHFVHFMAFGLLHSRCFIPLWCIEFVTSKNYRLHIWREQKAVYVFLCACIQRRGVGKE